MIDFPLKFCDQDQYQAWFTGSEWLSLDRFERFWPDVGLALSNGKAVQSATRAALRVEYANLTASRARWAADPDAEDDLYHLDRLEALAKVFLRSVEETAGTQDAECVAGWLA